MIARDLGRTHAELLHDTSGRELTWWKALYMVEADERKHEAEKQKAGMKR